MPRFGPSVQVEVLSLLRSLGRIEQFGLQIGRHRARDASVEAEVDPVGKTGMEVGEQRSRLHPAVGEALSFPDLVKPARIAAIAVEEVLAANAEPARDPDVDCICFGQAACGSAGALGGWDQGWHHAA